MAGTPEDRIYRQFKDVLWECLGAVRGLDVLDAGCGDGWLSKKLHDAGANVLGIDGSAELLHQARSSYPALEFIEHDLTQGIPPLGRTFDRIVAHMVLMDLPEIGALISSVRRSLNADGRFVFTIPHPCFFNFKSRRDETTGRLFRMVTGYLKPEVWRIETFGGHNHYHRSLTYYCDHLRTNQLAVTRLYEPPHIPGSDRQDTEFYTNIPVFMLIEAVPLPVR